MIRFVSNLVKVALVAVVAALFLVPGAASAQYQEPTTTLPSDVGGGGGSQGGGTQGGGTQGGALPRTGSSDNTMTLVTVGTALVVAGGLAVYGVRRQRGALD